MKRYVCPECGDPIGRDDPLVLCELTFGGARLSLADVEKIIAAYGAPPDSIKMGDEVVVEMAFVCEPCSRRLNVRVLP